MQAGKGACHIELSIKRLYQNLRLRLGITLFVGYKLGTLHLPNAFGSSDAGESKMDTEGYRTRVVLYPAHSSQGERENDTQKNNYHCLLKTKPTKFMYPHSAPTQTQPSPSSCSQDFHSLLVEVIFLVGLRICTYFLIHKVTEAS